MTFETLFELLERFEDGYTEDIAVLELLTEKGELYAYPESPNELDSDRLMALMKSAIAEYDDLLRRTILSNICYKLWRLEVDGKVLSPDVVEDAVTSARIEAYQPPKKYKYG